MMLRPAAIGQIFAPRNLDSSPGPPTTCRQPRDARAPRPIRNRGRRQFRALRRKRCLLPCSSSRPSDPGLHAAGEYIASARVRWRHSSALTAIVVFSLGRAYGIATEDFRPDPSSGSSGARKTCSRDPMVETYISLRFRIVGGRPPVGAASEARIDERAFAAGHRLRAHFRTTVYRPSRPARFASRRRAGQEFPARAIENVIEAVAVGLREQLPFHAI